MINIFLCDDTPLQLRHVHEFIENYMQNQPACINTTLILKESLPHD